MLMGETDGRRDDRDATEEQQMKQGDCYATEQDGPSRGTIKQGVSTIRKEASAGGVRHFRNPPAEKHHGMLNTRSTPISHHSATDAISNQEATVLFSYMSRQATVKIPRRLFTVSAKSPSLAFRMTLNAHLPSSARTSS